MCKLRILITLIRFCTALVVDLYGRKLPADVHGIHHSVCLMPQHVCVLESEAVFSF
jgi:hypothetical protein